MEGISEISQDKLLHDLTHLWKDMERQDKGTDYSEQDKPLALD